jgi:cardiolipin synthase
MNHTSPKDNQHKVLTIPNLLSAFRLILIPVFVWLYCWKAEYLWTAVILCLSGLTDMLDGYIARHFHMVSDLGKMLDPVADKLTQVAMLGCLLTRFPLMWVPLLLLVLKETVSGIMGLLVIHRTGRVHGAVWHGKVTTCLLYAMMIVHVVWYDLPVTLSNALIAACMAMMLLSMVLYGLRNLKFLKAG